MACGNTVNGEIGKIAETIGTFSNDSFDIWNDAVSSASSLQSSLLDVVGFSSPSRSVDTGITGSTVPRFSSPVNVSQRSNSYSIPGFDCECPTTVDGLSLDVAPVFDDPEPVLSIIQKPSPITTQSPVPENILEFSYPDAPSKVFPEAKSLRELSLPEIPVIDDITYDDLSNITLEDAPDVKFVYNENQYGTALLTELNSRLISFIGGFSTGLNAFVESAIFDRAEYRENTLADRLKINARRIWRSAGHSARDAYEKEQQAEQFGVSTRLVGERDKDIAVEFLEQENYKSSFINAVQLESQLLTYTGQVKQRELDAAIFTTQIIIDLYDLQVTNFKAQLQAYQVQGEIYTYRIKAELSKIEVYRAYLDGQRLVNSLNSQDIDIYRQKIQAVVKTFGLYKAEIDILNSKIGGEKIKLDMFAEKIRALDNEVSAKSVEYEGYSAEIQAELTKIKINDEMSDVFKNKIDGYKSLVDSKILGKNIDLKIGLEMPLKALDASSTIKTTTEAIKTALIGIETDLMMANVGAFAANVKGSATSYTASIDGKITDIEKSILEAGLKADSIRLGVADIKASEVDRSKAINSGGRTASQIIAAIGSVQSKNYSISESVSKSRSGSTSLSTSQSCSTSSSFSNSHTYLFNNN